MAGKTPGTPRKSTSSKKAPAKKASTVTPIDQGGLPQNGNNTVTNEILSQPTGLELMERIRARAYELFEQRGRLEGFDQQDWAQAEAEVMAKFQREKSA
jgi:hypothetical protein